MKKAICIIFISAQLLMAQSVGIGLKGGWRQVKSSPMVTYYYDDFFALAQTQILKNLTADGSTASLVIQLNSKTDHFIFNGEVQFSRLSGKTDSLRIFPSPYS
jgi:hypothetical protein